MTLRPRGIKSRSQSSELQKGHVEKEETSGERNMLRRGKCPILSQFGIGVSATWLNSRRCRCWSGNYTGHPRVGAGKRITECVIGVTKSGLAGEGGREGRRRRPAAWRTSSTRQRRPATDSVTMFTHRELINTPALLCDAAMAASALGR